MKFLSTAALLTLGLGAMFPALAQTVTMKSLHHQEDMTIAGTVSSVVDKSFTLSNGNRELRVNATSRWYNPISLSPGEQLIVAGALRDDEFEAYRITRANGEVITLGKGLSRLPWMKKSRR